MKLKWDCDKKPEALARGDWFRTEHGFVEFDERIKSTPTIYAVMYYRDGEAGGDRVKGICMMPVNGMISVYRHDHSSVDIQAVRAALRRILYDYEHIVIADDRRGGAETTAAKNRERDLDVAKTWLKLDGERRAVFTNWTRADLFPPQIKEGMRLIDSISGDLYPVTKDAYARYSGWVITYQDPSTNLIHTMVRNADVQFPVEVKV